MAKLTQWTSKIVNSNDSAAEVVAPALATRLTGQRLWLRTFYAQRTGGKKVAAYVDAVSLNLYPVPKQARREASMTLLTACAPCCSRPASTSRCGTPRSTTGCSVAARRSASSLPSRRPTSRAPSC